MAFIDIFNFKKYFLKPSDSQVARYGHINALYNDLSESLSQNQITTGTVTQSAIDQSVTINARAGKITLAGSITYANPNSFTINNSEVTENSIILVTVEAQYNGGNPFKSSTAVISNITDGTFDICIKSVSETESSPIGGGYVHFFIIN
jgi:predicted porin